MQLKAILGLVLALGALAEAYQYPIQQQLASARAQQVAAAKQVQRQRQSISRRSDEDIFEIKPQQQHYSSVANSAASGAGPSEENRLHQLREIVDTVAHILNEEEQQGSASGEKNIDHGIRQRRAHEVISESAIRQAIEELEKIQNQQEQMLAQPSQLEKQMAPKVASLAPQSSALTSKESAIDSLIEELGDELMEDQLTAASQESERLMPPARPALESAKVTATSATATRSANTNVPPVGQQNQSSKATSSSADDQSSLFSGNLASELGDALTSDFYSFHESSPTGSEKSSNNERPSVTEKDSKISREDSGSISRTQNDLEPSAQTRNSIAQHGHLPQINGQPIQHHNQRFDISQPPQATHTETLIRSLRQQQQQPPRLVNNNNNGPPTSTLFPILAQNDFWIPSTSINQGESRIPDLSQQYNVAKEQEQNLPESRFRSLGPASPFSQPAPVVNREPKHIHYTGHSLVASNDFSQPSHQEPRDHGFSSTSAPIISVLSGAGSSGPNSVSWNPPATVDGLSPNTVAHHQSFNQHYTGPTLHQQPFFQPTDKSQQQQGLRNLPNQQHQAQHNNNHFNGVTTEPARDTRFSPLQSESWNRFVSSTQPSRERVTADSTSHSSVGPVQDNHQHSFSTNDRHEGPTSTFSPLQTDAPIRSAFPSTTLRSTTTTTTTATSTTPPIPTTGASNTTKKEDTVIYYYYYYDDNKNATVIAKNVSSANPDTSISLDKAIESDGGIEDIPYIDDPEPIKVQNDVPTTSFSPISSTTTSTLAPTHQGILPSRNLENQLLPRPLDSQGDNSFANLGQPIDEVSEIPPEVRPRVKDQTRLSSPAPVYAPSVSSFKPAVSRSSSVSEQSVNRNRFVETSSPFSAGPSSTQSRPVDITPRVLTSTLASTSASPNPVKLQSDLINSILAGVPSGSAAGLRIKPSSGRTTSSTISNQSRGPLSNASRYGSSSNNAAMDPYGNDPSVPTPVTPNANSAISHIHRNRPTSVNSSTQAPKKVVHQASATNHEAISDSSSTPKSTASTNMRLPSSSFASQRNSINHASSPASIASLVQSTPATTLNTQRNQEVFAQTSKKHLVENQDNSLEPLVKVSHQSNGKLESFASGSHKEQNSFGSSTDPIDIRSGENQEINKLVSTNNVRQPVVQSGQNNRLSQQSPVSFTTSQAPPSSTHHDRTPAVSSLPSTQSSVSTSVSKSFSFPIQQTQSTSPNSVSTTAPTIVSSTTTQSTSLTTVSSSKPEVVSSTTAASMSSSESSSPSEDSASSSSRKKFGNRTNRFQTRLNSVSSARSTTSTTTTTPAPVVVSTTRRTVSTTPRSSKQIFSGRRRLGSTSSGSEATSSTSSPPALGSSAEVSESETTQSTRAKFGDSFGPRSQSAKPSAVSVTESFSSTTSSSIAKSTLLGSQKSTQKPRTQFLKNNRLPNTSPVPESTNVSSEANQTRQSNNSTTGVVSEKTVNISSTESSAKIAEESSVETTESEIPANKEQPISTSSVSEASLPSATSATVAPEAPATGRNKPKLRPLFASRQRSASLFGNRRNSTSSGA